MSKIHEFIEAVKDGDGYDWIANNGHELNKYELIDILKEYDYAIYSMKPYDDKEDVYNSIYEELSDLYFEEE